MNMTKALEALSPYLENPRQIVIRSEAFVVAAAAMLFLQLMLGPWRRRFVQGTLWVAYTASFPLITYTLGQMVTSPVKNMLYPVWAVILFWAAGCANALMAYSIEDNRRWKRYLFELLQYMVYLSVIFKLFNAGHPFAERMVSTHPIVFTLSLLTCMAFWANLYRVVAGWMVTNSTPSKLVADYMRAQVQANTRSRAAQEETFTMSGCKYLVQHPFMEDNPCDDHRAITIEAIWGMPFDGDSLLEKQLRDVCLSFALSHLLRRRYFGLDCAEAGLPKTLLFALDGLLPEEDQVNHYSGAFHVIEVELGFLYDSLFTKYATLFLLESIFLMLVIFKLICASVCGVVLIAYPPTVKTPDPIIEVGTRRVDVTVTVLIVGALLVFELLEAILYLTSDWATVSLACSYTRGDQGKPIPSIILFLRRFKFVNILSRRINLFGYWQNKMGQSSVIGHNLFVHRLYVGHMRGDLVSSALHQAYNLICLMIFPVKNFVAVPDLVKTYIVSCLRIYGTDGGSLANGIASLQRNGVLGDFSSTLEKDSQIKVMLIWHIATEYCNIAIFNGAEEGLHQSDAQQVATTLSKYCAYLMYFIPELLAENSTDTLFIVHNVVKEVQNALGGDKPTKDRLLRIIQDSESSRRNQDQTVAQDSTTNNNEDSILIRGLKLGRDLEAKDVDLRWKVMAEFWAETIIYIAPSDKAAEHMERLAQGGEFLTHVWALLNHAGILNRD
uniref:DUF4220 domain-containing protein n=1 Tax=Triticum urartu TaxID=4572 RepID=A0A8R7TP31_TRIUA